MHKEGLINLSELNQQPKILAQEAGKLQRIIAWETMVNRGWTGFAKYGTYFSFMWLAGLKYPDGARLLRSANFYWREVDDIADKDKPLPSKYQSREQYLVSKKIIIESLFAGLHPVHGDREDILLADYCYLAKKMNFDLKQESVDILDSIIFDEKRARDRRILTQKELDYYFELLDPACIRGALKVAEESIDPAELHPLSMAVRTMFNLRDFPKDFRDGLINISSEDIESYGVDFAELQGRSTIAELISYDPMRSWYHDQTEAGLRYLDESTERLAQFPLKKVTRIVLGMHFEGPSRKKLSKYARILAA